MKCTWKNCKSEGLHSIKDEDGQQWALLCDKHNEFRNRKLHSRPSLEVLNVAVCAIGGVQN